MMTCVPLSTAPSEMLTIDYIADCVLFCNKLATIGQGYFQCPSPICFAFFIVVKRPEKEVKLEIIAVLESSEVIQYL
jgi:hypothetical protein